MLQLHRTVVLLVMHISGWQHRILARVLPLLVLLPAGILRAEDWSPLWTTATLSQARCALTAASTGNKVVFAGGEATSGFSSVVDIYDTVSGAWSTATLSEGRRVLSATSASSKGFFGGGDNGSGVYSTAVDIYDTSSGLWSRANLSQSREWLSATSASNKVFFGGGLIGNVVPYFSNVVDICDTSSGAWSTATLSEGRDVLSAASTGNKVVFGGGYGLSGYSNVVDIYDMANGTWSAATLSQARGFLSATSAGSKVFFGGGATGSGFSTVVDIYDAVSGAWSTASLSQAREMLSATSAGNKVFFAGGYNDSGASSVVDIYDTSTGTWSTATLSRQTYQLSAASAGNKAFFGGGRTDGVYSNSVDIYTFQSYGTITSSQAFTLVDQTTIAGRMQLNAPGSLNLATYRLTVGAMSGDAPIDLGSGTLTTGSDNTSTTYSGAIIGSGSLTKEGSGTQVLSHDNSYTGPTTVNAGRLLVDGTYNGDGAYTVAGSATLGGHGTIGTSAHHSIISVAPGGTLAPGDDLGSISALSTWGDVSLGGILFLDLDGSGSGTSDRLNVYGALDITSATVDFNTHGTLDDPVYILATYSLLVGEQFASVVDLPAGYHLDYHYNGSNQIALVIPEPSTLGLLATGAIALIVYARRRWYDAFRWGGPVLG